MTTPARQAEADRVEVVYYWALNQMGNAMALDARELWEEVPATTQAAKAAWWLERLLRMLFGFRKEGQQLAIAYYRLTRALRTGYSPTEGSEVAGETVSLNALRDAFEEIVDHIDEQTASDVPFRAAGSEDTSPDPIVEDQPELDPEEDEDDAILLEQIADLERLIEEQDDAAEEEAALILDQLGIQNMLDLLAEQKAESDAEAAQEAARAAHAKAGDRQAAAAMRIMLNASRGLVYSLSETDQRCIGWARYSRTGTPCGWCAMLISRGPVYKSKASATMKNESDEYHDNCRCIAIPIFDLAQYAASGLFALNREMDLLWRNRIKGKFGGKRALTEWRKILRQMKQDARVLEAA